MALLIWVNLCILNSVTASSGLNGYTTVGTSTGRNYSNKPGYSPYLRLKNSKRTSSVKVFSSTTPENFFAKRLTMPKKIESGTLWDFSISILSQNSKKIEVGNILPKKSLAMPKQTERGDPLVSSGIVGYAGNLFGSVPSAN